MTRASARERRSAHLGSSVRRHLMPGDDGTRRGGPDAWRRCCLPDLDPWPHRRGGIAEVLTPLRSWVAGVSRHLSDRFLRASLTRNVGRRTDFCQKVGGGLMPKKGQRRGLSCASQQFASCLEGLASRLVSGQTLGSSGRHAAGLVGRPAAIRASRPDQVGNPCPTWAPSSAITA